MRTPTISNYNDSKSDTEMLLEKAWLLFPQNFHESLSVAQSVYHNGLSNSDSKILLKSLHLILQNYRTMCLLSQKAENWIEIAETVLQGGQQYIAEKADVSLVLSELYTLQGKFTKAIFHLKSAMDLYQQVGHIPTHAHVAGAYVYFHNDEMVKGCEHLSQARATLSERFFDNNEYVLGSVTAHNNIITRLRFSHLAGLYHFYLRNYSLAENYINNGLDSLHSDNFILYKAHLLDVLCSIHAKTHRIEQLRTDAKQLYTIYHHTDSNDIGTMAYKHLFRLAVLQQNTSEALPCAKKAYELSKRTFDVRIKLEGLYIFLESFELSQESINKTQKYIVQAQAFLPYVKRKEYNITMLHLQYRYYVAAGLDDIALRFLEQYTQAATSPEIDILRDRIMQHNELQTSTSVPKSFLKSSTAEYLSDNFLQSEKNQEGHFLPAALRHTSVHTRNLFLEHSLDVQYPDAPEPAIIKQNVRPTMHIHELWQMLDNAPSVKHDSPVQIERDVTFSQQDFMMKLSERFPELSHTELRVCVLLRMNLNTQQISIMMGISPATVFTHRKHIRKKMGLEDRKSLNVYLLNFTV